LTQLQGLHAAKDTSRAPQNRKTGGERLIGLNYRDSRPIYEQIKDNYKRLIISGALAPDEKLPSVRELASQLAINPNTIQRAYRELESEGYIYTIPGKGSFTGKKQEVRDVRTEEMKREFDKLASRLMLAGVSREELIERINDIEGGESRD